MTGEAFAWVVGTLELLTTCERNLVKGIIFNKFHGDKNILEPGLDMLESRINKPVVGVIPYIHDLSIDDEDSVSLEYMNDNKSAKPENRRVGFGVRNFCESQAFSLQHSVHRYCRNKIARISNFTDFLTYLPMKRM
ncbi:MAG: hypothetical protein U0586_07525 [Candidatus Brocadiaceae bacterium]